MNRLSPKQTEALLRDLNPKRVLKLSGNAYLTQHDVRAMLTRAFGFAGWSLKQLHEPRMLFQQDRMIGKEPNKYPGFAVCYLCSVAIVIHTPDGDTEYQGTGTAVAVMGEQALGDCHDSALKSADSAALKRAAINLGTQFGLSLYHGGTTADIVSKVWDGEKFITHKDLAHNQPTEPEDEPLADPQPEDEYTTATQEEGTS